MIQYARRYVTSLFDDVMQLLPGKKNDGNFPFQEKNNHLHLLSFVSIVFRF